MPVPTGRRSTQLAVAGCVVLLAACGSSSKPSVPAADQHALGVKFSTCMRGHGVPDFPDPETAAGIQIPLGFEAHPSPAFKSAQQACRYLVPPGGGPPPASAGEKAAALRLAQCMRQHGVADYPDPTYHDGQEIPPAIANPAVNPASPAFTAAAKKCQQP